MGKSTISMAIFNCYVSLPEGITIKVIIDPSIYPPFPHQYLKSTTSYYYHNQSPLYFEHVQIYSIHFSIPYNAVILFLLEYLYIFSIPNDIP